MSGCDFLLVMELRTEVRWTFQRFPSRAWRGALAGGQCVQTFYQMVCDGQPDQSTTEWE